MQKNAVVEYVMQSAHVMYPNAMQTELAKLRQNLNHGSLDGQTIGGHVWAILGDINIATAISLLVQEQFPELPTSPEEALAALA